MTHDPESYRLHLLQLVRIVHVRHVGQKHFAQILIPLSLTAQLVDHAFCLSNATVRTVFPRLRFHNLHVTQVLVIVTRIPLLFQFVLF